MNRTVSQKLCSFWLIVISILLGTFTTEKTINFLTPAIFQGKSLSERSETVQFLLYIIFYIFFSLIFYIFNKTFLKEIQKNQNAIKFISSLCSQIKARIKIFENSKRVTIALILLILLLVLIILFIHLKIVLFPYSLELRESAIQLSTHALLMVLILIKSPITLFL